MFSPASTRFCATPCRAFTVMETLLGLLILAVLAALLYPAYLRSRVATETSICAGNLRKLGAGSYAYAADHEGEIPPGSLAKVGSLEDLLEPYVAPWVDKQRLIAADAFYCPTNVRLGSPPKWGFETGADGKGRYKGWSGYMIGYRINAGVHRVIGVDDPTTPLRFNQVRSHSKTFMLADTNTRQAGGGPPTSLFANGNYLNPQHSNFSWFGDVHNGWCNILFVDGHVEKFNRSRRLPIISVPSQEVPWYP